MHLKSNFRKINCDDRGLQKFICYYSLFRLDSYFDFIVDLKSNVRKMRTPV